MRAHIIEDGKVVNTIEVESLDFMPDLVDAELGGKIDDLWDGEQFSAPPKVMQTVQEYIDAVQAHLDAAAKARGYDNIVSACSYAGAPNPFQAEGITFVTWRGDVWATCYTIMGEVQAGGRPAPTIAELIAALPEIAL